METQEGELPREYIVQKLYSGAHMDPSNAKDARRIIRLAQKDVTDYKDAAGVEENKKT